MVKLFKIARFAFNLEALEGISLSLYKGSTFRGGFGYAFKKTVCALKSQTCDLCLLREKCVPFLSAYQTLRGAVVPGTVAFFLLIKVRDLGWMPEDVFPKREGLVVGIMKMLNKMIAQRMHTLA